ncbi:hypothetical protein [Nereida sp. NH-UV-3]|uniref:hypothetical protein n=1 Tax=Nereida TaxID=282198 RepID=UPI0036F2BE58
MSTHFTTNKNGFSCAELMLDHIGLSHTFDGGRLPSVYPFGRGLNAQIEVPNIIPLIAALEVAGVPPFLTPEEKWYRCEQHEVGNR